MCMDFRKYSGRSETTTLDFMNFPGDLFGVSDIYNSLSNSVKNILFPSNGKHAFINDFVKIHKKPWKGHIKKCIRQAEVGESIETPKYFEIRPSGREINARIYEKQNGEIISKNYRWKVPIHRRFLS